jgi:hypothetical protein
MDTVTQIDSKSKPETKVRWPRFYFFFFISCSRSSLECSNKLLPYRSSPRKIESLRPRVRLKLASDCLLGLH